MGGESLLSDLHTGRSNWKVVVKVMKRWETTNPGNLKWIDFILVDEEGSKILTSVGNLYHAYFKQEDLWVVITGFLVRRSNKENNSFNMTKSDYSILFKDDTRVRLVDVISDSHNMDFTDFKYVVQTSQDGIYPVDLIGVIESVGPLRPYIDNGSFKNSLRFRIRNYSDIIFDCIVVGELAEVFHPKWCLVPKGEIIVCFLNDWKVTNIRGATLIRDGGGISRVFFELDFSEVHTLRYIYSLNEKSKKIDVQKPPSQ